MSMESVWAAASVLESAASLESVWAAASVQAPDSPSEMVWESQSAKMLVLASAAVETNKDRRVEMNVLNN